MLIIMPTQMCVILMSVLNTALNYTTSAKRIKREIDESILYFHDEILSLR